MKNLDIKDQLFKNLDSLISEYGYTKANDIFRLLNEYQNYRLSDIENSNNEKHRVALSRTLLYSDIEILEKYRKTKSEKTQKGLLIKIVNSFCLQIPELKYKDYSGATKEMYDIIITFKDKIIENEEWYLRVIPE